MVLINRLRFHLCRENSTSKGKIKYSYAKVLNAGFGLRSWMIIYSPLWSDFSWMVIPPCCVWATGCSHGSRSRLRQSHRESSGRQVAARHAGPDAHQSRRFSHPAPARLGKGASRPVAPMKGASGFPAPSRSGLFPGSPCGTQPAHDYPNCEGFYNVLLPHCSTVSE